MENIDKDLESFSSMELRNFKVISLIIKILLVVIAIILSVLLCVYYYKNNNIYCNDTGLFRIIKGDKIYSIDERTDTGIIKKSKKEEQEEIAISIANDLALLCQGYEFNYSDYKISKLCRNVITKYINKYTIGSDFLNLTDYFGISDGFIYLDGDAIIEVININGNDIKVREWLPEVIDNSVEVSSDIIPNDVKELAENVDIISYIEYTSDIYNYIQNDIKQKDGKFVIYTKDMQNYIDDTGNLSISFFGDRIVDLENIESDKWLRELNPQNRFTWIYDRTEFVDNKYYNYFKNSKTSEESYISVSFDSDTVNNIEMIDFE